MAPWSSDDLDRIGSPKIVGSVVGTEAHDVTMRLVPAGEPST